VVLGNDNKIAELDETSLPSANTSLLDDQPASEYQLYAEENGGAEVEDIILHKL